MGNCRASRWSCIALNDMMKLVISYSDGSNILCEITIECSTASKRSGTGQEFLGFSSRLLAQYDPRLAALQLPTVILQRCCAAKIDMAICQVPNTGGTENYF